MYVAGPRPWVDVRAFGCKGDVQLQATGAISPGSATLTTTGSPSFVASDAGKAIYVLGAGVAGATLVTTIASYVSATQVTLTLAASTTVSNANVVWGTDDTANFQAALNAANYDTNGLGESLPLVIPEGNYLITATLVCRCDITGFSNTFGRHGGILYYMGTGTCLQNTSAYTTGWNVRHLRIDCQYNATAGVIGIEARDGAVNAWFEQVKVIGFDFNGTTAYGIYLRGRNPSSGAANNVTANHILDCTLTRCAVSLRLGDNITNGQAILNVVTGSSLGFCTTAGLYVTGYANNFVGLDLGDSGNCVNCVVFDGGFVHNNLFAGCSFATKASGPSNAAVLINSNVNTFGNGAIAVFSSYVLQSPTNVLVNDQGSALEPRYTDLTNPLLHKLLVKGVQAGDQSLVVRGVTGQTGDLQDWQNPGGTNLARIDAAGNLSAAGYAAIGGVSVTPVDSTGLSVGGRAQTGTANRFRMFQSMARSHLSAQAQPVGNATATVIPFDGNDVNTDGQWSSGANTRLTAQIPGKYLIAASVLWAGSANGTRTLDLRKNGVGALAQDDTNALSNGSSQAQCIVDIESLAQNDYVEVLATQTSGASLNVINDPRTYFAMHYIGE